MRFKLEVPELGADLSRAFGTRFVKATFEEARKERRKINRTIAEMRKLRSYGVVSEMSAYSQFFDGFVERWQSQQKDFNGNLNDLHLGMFIVNTASTSSKDGPYFYFDAVDRGRPGFTVKVKKRLKYFGSKPQAGTSSRVPPIKRNGLIAHTYFSVAVGPSKPYYITSRALRKIRQEVNEFTVLTLRRFVSNHVKNKVEEKAITPEDAFTLEHLAFTGKKAAPKVRQKRSRKKEREYRREVKTALQSAELLDLFRQSRERKEVETVRGTRGGRDEATSEILRQNSALSAAESQIDYEKALANAKTDEERDAITDAYFSRHADEGTKEEVKEEVDKKVEFRAAQRSRLADFENQTFTLIPDVPVDFSSYTTRVDNQYWEDVAKQRIFSVTRKALRAKSEVYRKLDKAEHAEFMKKMVKLAQEARKQVLKERRELDRVSQQIARRIMGGINGNKLYFGINSETGGRIYSGFSSDPEENAHLAGKRSTIAGDESQRVDRPTIFNQGRALIWEAMLNIQSRDALIQMLTYNCTLGINHFQDATPERVTLKYGTDGRVYIPRGALKRGYRMVANKNVTNRMRHGRNSHPK